VEGDLGFSRLEASLEEKETREAGHLLALSEGCVCVCVCFRLPQGELS
jgi:hypothetical protein